MLIPDVLGDKRFVRYTEWWDADYFGLPVIHFQLIARCLYSGQKCAINHVLPASDLLLSHGDYYQKVRDELFRQMAETPC